MAGFDHSMKLTDKKNLALVFAIIILVVGYLDGTGTSTPPRSNQTSDNHSVADGDLRRAISQQLSDVQVRGQGVVTRFLKDDNDGSRHQRFILEIFPGQTVLVAHNIDLAPRLDSLELGDKLEFYGEYEWNTQGGVIHWTHHDPAGRHPGGWLKLDGKTYQ